MRFTGNFPLKNLLIATIRGYSWPDVTLPARRVNLISGSTIKLTPHVGELDFDALFSTDIRYEPEVYSALKRRLGDYDAIVEVGANVGFFSCFFARETKIMGKNTSIFAFEPSTKAFLRLLANINANELDNIYAFNAALLDQTGFVEFHEPVGHLSNGSINKKFAGIFSEQINSTLVVACAGEQLSQLLKVYSKILIKLDAEGAEEVILENLEEIIREKRPDIVLEVLDLFEESLNALTFLKQEYVFFLITEEGLIRQENFKAHNAYRDYYLIPRDISSPHRKSF